MDKERLFIVDKSGSDFHSIEQTYMGSFCKL